MAPTKKSPTPSELQKYAKRPSPPHPANDYPDETMEGNDGNLYISKPTKAGVYRWTKVSADAPKAKAKKTPPPPPPVESDSEYDSDSDDETYEEDEKVKYTTVFKSFTAHFDLGKQMLYKNHASVTVPQGKFTFKDGRYITFTTKDESVPMRYNYYWNGTYNILEKPIEEMMEKVKLLKAVDIEEMKEVLHTLQYEKPLQFELVTEIAEMSPMDAIGYSKPGKAVIVDKTKLMKITDYIKRSIISRKYTDFDILHILEPNVDKFFKAMHVDGKKITFKNYYSDEVMIVCKGLL